MVAGPAAFMRSAWSIEIESTCVGVAVCAITVCAVLCASAPEHATTSMASVRANAMLDADGVSLRKLMKAAGAPPGPVTTCAVLPLGS